MCCKDGDSEILDSLTLGAHAHNEGYSSCRVCMCVLNFADFPKNASFKRYGVICLPRAAPAS